MNKFWSSFLGSALGTLVAIFGTFIISLILFFALISSLANPADPAKSEPLKDNSVLHLNLNYAITERTNDDPLAGIGSMNFSTDKKLGLHDLLTCIEAAKSDDKIKGIHMDLENVSIGSASAEEIRKALEDFKSSGKFIYSYAENVSQNAYYLASAGSKIYVDPMGGVEFKGISAGFMSFKSAMDKIGLKAVILRPDSNKFKSAVEPFFLEKMSPENRAQTSLFVHAIWDKMVQDIAQSRNLSAGILNNIAENLLAFDGEEALKAGMIDKLAFKDEYWKDLKTLVGLEEKDKLRLVKPEQYLERAKELTSDKSKDKIAVLYANGSISNGEGDENEIGSATMAATLKKIREDESIKALVLRINSPGGSAQASEIIWHEIELTKAKMPVIVSMGDYAASGGYYIACNADTIVADANTLTGSIGVFGLLVNTQELFEENLGLKSDTVNTHANADFFNTNRGLSATEQRVLMKSVNKTYQTFLRRVADGRGMTVRQVDQIAQGRIWSGTDAKQIGLVDVIGDMKVAMDIAARKAGLTQYEIVEYPKIENTLEKIFIKKTEDVIEDAGVKYLGEHFRLLKYVRSLRHNNGVQARMPYAIEIN
jgi:protease-4